LRRGKSRDEKEGKKKKGQTRGGSPERLSNDL